MAAKIERKAFYVGTWRDDFVTDTTMRQIIARSHAEKGQKVKLKLSSEGLRLSRTVLFQETFLMSFPLRDVFFVTVSQRHPTCLVCIVADPVRKYLILALRAVSQVEAQEVISVFQALKDTGAQQAGNVTMQRKDNGNWTLKDRSRHNADRQLKEIFKESSTASSSSSPSPSPFADLNGSAGDQTDVGDGDVPVLNGSGRVESGSQTVVVDGSEADMAQMRTEVEMLSQELRDIKLVLERASSNISPVPLHTTKTLPNHHHNHNSAAAEKSHYITEHHTAGGPTATITATNNNNYTLTSSKDYTTTNGTIVTAHSDGDAALRPGEARAVVEDHRQEGMVRAFSRGSAAPANPVITNGRVNRQITVPPGPRPSSGFPSPSSNGVMDGYPGYRTVSTDFVPVTARSARSLSGSESVRGSARVTFEQEPARRKHAFRSMRTSRGSAVPSTIARPIEEIYSQTWAARHRPTILRTQSVPQHPSAQAYVTQHLQQQQTNSPVYLVQQPVYVSRPLTPTHSLRRSRAGSSSTMDGSDLHVFHTPGELDDVLL